MLDPVYLVAFSGHRPNGTPGRTDQDLENTAPHVRAEQMERNLSSRHSISLSADRSPPGWGLLLSFSDLPSKIFRGTQEHDLFHDTTTGLYFKDTRHGVFGLSPGIELALVSSSQDARRFELWEASPLAYLQRLHPQNPLVHHPAHPAVCGVPD